MGASKELPKRSFAWFMNVGARESFSLVLCVFRIPADEHGVAGVQTVIRHSSRRGCCLSCGFLLREGGSDAKE